MFNLLFSLPHFFSLCPKLYTLPSPTSNPREIGLPHFHKPPSPLPSVLSTFRNYSCDVITDNGTSCSGFDCVCFSVLALCSWASTDSILPRLRNIAKMSFTICFEILQILFFKFCSSNSDKFYLTIPIIPKIPMHVITSINIAMWSLWNSLTFTDVYRYRCLLS